MVNADFSSAKTNKKDGMRLLTLLSLTLSSIRYSEIKTKYTSKCFLRSKRLLKING